jgi:hypothetical protein
MLKFQNMSHGYSSWPQVQKCNTLGACCLWLHRLSADGVSRASATCYNHDEHWVMLATGDRLGAKERPYHSRSIRVQWHRVLVVKANEVSTGCGAG